MALTEPSRQDQLEDIIARVQFQMIVSAYVPGPSEWLVDITALAAFRSWASHPSVPLELTEQVCQYMMEQAEPADPLPWTASGVRSIIQAKRRRR